MFGKDSHYKENHYHDLHDMYYFFNSRGLVLVKEVKTGSDFTIFDKVQHGFQTLKFSFYQAKS